MLLYVDTCVWIDFVRSRDSAAYNLFMRAAKCEFSLVISTLVLFELHKHDALQQPFIDMLQKAEKLSIEPILEEDRRSGLASHEADSVHAAVALRKGAILVTDNVRDFIVPGLSVRRPKTFVNK